MSKVVSRLLVFFIGIPVVLGIVFIPFQNHLALHLLICLVSVGASLEMHSMLAKRLPLPPKPLVAALSVLMPLAAAVQVLAPQVASTRLTGGLDFLTAVLIVALVISLAYEVLTARSFDGSIARLSGTALILLYAGYLMTFLSRLTTATVHHKDASVPLIATFLLMVFLCDSIAWLFGVLLGKNNRGFIKASPNKSIAGFVGGFIGSFAAAVAGFLLWPGTFGQSLAPLAVTSVFTAFAAIVGDLVESVLKRSAGVKDSGSVIPGRGGILDSIDSILLALPVYYLLMSAFYGPLA